MFHDNFDLQQIMKRYAQMNPHIAISELAFLMDLPYDHDEEEALPEIN